MILMMGYNHERKGDRDNQQDITLPVMTVTNPRKISQYFHLKLVCPICPLPAGIVYTQYNKD